MKVITVGDGVVEIRLPGWEKVAGLVGDQRVPIDSVTAVSVEPDPLAALRGVRAPGLSVPFGAKIGTWRGRGGRRFVRVRPGVPAVRIVATGQRFTEFLVSVPDAADVAAAIERSLPDAPDR